MKSPETLSTDLFFCWGAPFFCRSFDIFCIYVWDCVGHAQQVTKVDFLELRLKRQRRLTLRQQQRGEYGTSSNNNQSERVSQSNMNI